MEEQQRKKSSSKTCSRGLFNTSSGQSNCESKGKEKEREVEVEKWIISAKQAEEPRREVVDPNQVNALKIEFVAESLGEMEISKTRKDKETSQ